MYPGFKRINAEECKTLLVIVLICNNFCIRMNNANMVNRTDDGDHHQVVKRQAFTDYDPQRAWSTPPKHEYRFAVLLRAEFESKEILCHGVLVAPHIALSVTVKACLALKPGNAIAIAGFHDIKKPEVTVQSREVCHIDIHPKGSDGKTISYMILHLSDPFYLNDYVGAISLPLPSVDVSKLKECMIVGWKNGTAGSTPVHSPMQIKTCKNPQPDLICSESGPCTDVGAPLTCDQGNREFIAGLYTSSGCSQGSDTSYLSLMFKDFQKWFKETVKKAPQNCCARHG